MEARSIKAERDWLDFDELYLFVEDARPVSACVDVCNW